MPPKAEAVILHHSASSPDKYPPTGYGTIDALRALQKVAWGIQKVDERIAYCKRAIPRMSAEKLVGSELIISTTAPLVEHQKSGGLLRMQSGLFLAATVKTYGYLFDKNTALDDITVHLEDISILGRHAPNETPLRGDTDAVSIEGVTFQVPIMSIDMCMDQTAAA